MGSTSGCGYTIGLVVPFQGSEGLYGPSCVLCARLAVEELNAGSGVLARPVRLKIIDGAAAADRVTRNVAAAIGSGQIDAVVGWHLSTVRQRLVPVVSGRVPYVFTALYEGGETARGVVTIGETPEIQLHPALRWMAEEVDVRRWIVVGNDYVWPRRTTEVVRAALRDRGDPQIDEALFVGLGTVDYEPVLRRIETGTADGVLVLLVGADAVAFHRQFAQRELQDRFARFSPLMDESMLRATGPSAAQDVFTASGYFEALTTTESLGFGARYVRRFGPGAPVLNAVGESCYEGVRVLAQLVNRAGSNDATSVASVAERTGYDGPRGTVLVRGTRTEQRIYLAVADGPNYDILDSL